MLSVPRANHTQPAVAPPLESTIDTTTTNANLATVVIKPPVRPPGPVPEGKSSDDEHSEEDSGS
jgi:hypothetical protein